MDTPEAAVNILSLPTELHCHIFSYLSFNDLKELRLTCSRFSDAVMESREFKDRLKISVNADNLSEIAECIQENEFRLSLTNVEFKIVNDCTEMTYVVQAIANDVHRLTLYEVKIYDALASVAMPNLRELKLSNPGKHRGENCQRWNFKSYRNLKALIMGPNEVDYSLQNHILKQVIELKTVHLETFSVTCCTNEALIINILKRDAKSLINLEIYFMDPPTTHYRNSWTEVFKNMEALKNLEIRGCEANAEWIHTSLTALPESVQLKSIAVSHTKSMTDELLSFIARKYQNSLEEADFSGCPKLTSRGFKELRKNVRNLKTLNLRYSRMRFKTFVFEQNIGLQELSLCFCEKLIDDCICKLAQNLTDLVFLDLSCCNVTDKTLAYIFRYQTRLQTLMLGNSTSISDKGLMGFGERKWPIPMPITRLKSLQSLDLRRAKELTDKAFSSVIKFKQLRALRLDSCDQITNEGIKVLTENCPTIEQLHLEECSKLTEDVLDIIVNGFKRLRKLNVWGRNITLEVRENFYKMNPRIKKTSKFIYNSYYCTKKK